MAIGRDYADVPPIRGSYRSHGEKSWMRVDLNISRDFHAIGSRAKRYNSQQ
jgi:hypothetical protein